MKRAGFSRATSASPVLELVSTAGNMRYVRAAMLDVIGQDYVRTARPKRLSERLTGGKRHTPSRRTRQ
jgi:ABC-type dipeptide/oligopeptide/nickel transport system permease component